MEGAARGTPLRSPRPRASVALHKRAPFSAELVTRPSYTRDPERYITAAFFWGGRLRTRARSCTSMQRAHVDSERPGHGGSDPLPPRHPGAARGEESGKTPALRRELGAPVLRRWPSPSQASPLFYTDPPWASAFIFFLPHPLTFCFDRDAAGVSYCPPSKKRRCCRR